MNSNTRPSQADQADFDVLIVGAGLSGICAAYHLQKHCPNQRYTILEGRDRMGGTWDLFRYPGVRSDSDMYTLGYSFRPWRRANGIGSGADILSYIKDTAAQENIVGNIRFNHRVTKASWDSSQALWRVEIEGDNASPISCRFLFMCSGYYDYERAYLPEWQGFSDFKGEVVHPQFWPDNLDYQGKRILVIGSGATAVTLVPELAKTASQVIMLQRSPTYIVARDTVGNTADEQATRPISPFRTSLRRWQSILYSVLIYQLSRWLPNLVRSMLRRNLRMHLDDHSQISSHFSPRYDPWDQRICLAPDGDFFDAINQGKATLVTDHIERFTDRGVELKSGDHIEADLIVTATGLIVKLFGGMQIEVDGDKRTLSDSMVYKGVMLNDVPNFAIAWGYVNASWTLKAELIANYVCRLINHMQRHQLDYCVALTEATDQRSEKTPLDLSSGYVQRAESALPRLGVKKPWVAYQNYLRDLVMLKFSGLLDKTLRFRRLGDESEAALTEPTRAR